jgi:membrane-bound lytic murein transglycosylase A
MRGWIAALLLSVAACAPEPFIVTSSPQPTGSTTAKVPAPVAATAKLLLKKTAFKNISGWHGDSHDQAVEVLLRSCAKISKKPADLPLGRIGGVAGDWFEPCRAAAAVPKGDGERARSYFESYFQPYIATADGHAEGLFTGYFEMELKGSWLRTKSNTTPIYERPPELVDANLGEFKSDLRGKRVSGKVAGGRFVPFDDRAEIEAGALSGRGLELMWVDSPIDAFFLHVQGSGRVVMDDGSIVRVGYAARNGHAYHSIGRELIKRGELTKERVSMQSIRAWLKDHPDQAAELMASNPSFIFFRVVEGALKSIGKEQGPIGAQGIPLSPGRSLAVDRRYIPLGIPIWLDTTNPLQPGEPLRRLVIAQDTGSAIRGPVRGDLFWGFGPRAALQAGLMKQAGHYFLLLPRKK